MVGLLVTLQRVGSWDFFGQVVEAGFHEAALQMVAEGKIDGAAIDCHVLSQKPRIAEQLRVIETLGPAPSQPVVVRAGLEAEVKTRIRRNFASLHDPLMNEFGVERFVPAPDYSAIADFVGTVRLLMVGDSRKSPTRTLSFSVPLPRRLQMSSLRPARSSQRCSS